MVLYGTGFRNAIGRVRILNGTYSIDHATHLATPKSQAWTNCIFICPRTFRCTDMSQCR